jgi:2-keto-4-pentenoate hydratase/2-oxohepta-3-ene-1,7-dioic acid hydratase in catechol pathway
MTVSILRTADAWWVHTPTGAARVSTTAATTRELLADRAAIEAAHSAGTVPVDSLHLLSPVTAPCRVVAQMTNYASHVKDAGRDPTATPLAFFRKASGSISGPFDDIVNPTTSGCSTTRSRSVWSSAAICPSGPRSPKPTSPTTSAGWW